jgi:hypothetical protein
MEPRIYTYKITFEGVPFWYWGVHKEQEFGEEYWGSPTTNAWVWDLYTPEKQILEFFPYTDEGWKEANSVEDRLIKPDINNPLCLNENYGGFISLKALRKGALIRNSMNLPVSDDTRQKLSKRLRERWEDEEYRDRNLPKTLDAQKMATAAAQTPEAKEKRKQTLEAIGHQIGDKNSQYGTKLIHNKNLRLTKRVDKNSPLDEGWEEGAIYDFDAYFERPRKKEEEKKQAELRKKRKWEEKRSLYAPWWEVYKNHTFREFCSITGYSKSHQNLLDKFTRYGLRGT